MDVLLFGVSIALPLSLWREIPTRKKARPPPTNLQEQLEQGTSLNAKERVCTVTSSNVPLPGGHDRATMRLNKLWHRATYCLIRHEPVGLPSHPQDDIYVLVQKRSHLKDYCPSLLDPTPGGVVGYEEDPLINITRELQEEMGLGNDDLLALKEHHLFVFPYQDDHVRVWGYFYEYIFRGTLSELQLQEEEVETVVRMNLQDLQHCMETQPTTFMPDSIHAMQLYFQYQKDLKLQRRFLKGSSSDLEAFLIRPKLEAIFFDCDDCLYFDHWKTANKLTAKIDEWCVHHGLAPGVAYQLYKQYGTALRGLLAEGYLEASDESIRQYLEDVHDIGVQDLIVPDPQLHAMLSRLDPSIPRYVFTASVEQHARRCLEALGIQEFFPHRIIDCLVCDLETKHSTHSFQRAMEVANVKHPQACLLLDDSITNIQAARQMGWRACLVGKIGRDSGQWITSEDAEIELDTIHEMESVFPELFVSVSSS